MHVLSFGEGRSLCVVLFVFSNFRRMCLEYAPVAIGWQTVSNSCDHLIYFAPRPGKACDLLNGDSIVEFVCCLPYDSTPQRDLLLLKPRSRFDDWASGLGIGFWLRGVQPRTTMR